MKLFSHGCIERSWEHRGNNQFNRNSESSTAPTKPKSQGPAYLQALIQNKIDRQGVKIQKVRQADSQTAAFSTDLREANEEIIITVYLRANASMDNNLLS